VIIDLPRFIAEEKLFWSELESVLQQLEQHPNDRMTLEQTRRFHYLYQRASADLAKLTTFASEPALRGYLESLVSRAYAEVHEVRRHAPALSVWRWFVVTFPQTFRRHVRAFWLSVAASLVGAVLGALFLYLEPDAKSVLLPFEHLRGDPSERVAWEENQGDVRAGQPKTAFSAFLMTNNTRVSITALALGMTWGIGTLVVLFYNGVIVGAVALDYIRAGETQFLLGWLLPHGSIELPAIMIAGQAGLVLGGALIGRGARMSLRARFRSVAPDVVTLIGGVAVMLVWAGIIEAFLSQYHEPVLPYAVKIAFGLVELGLLTWFLSRCGKGSEPATASPKTGESHG
jgi:uncharacterized membrane protein SpoIIM required for sporulation